MAYPPVVIVNANDKVVDWRPLPEAWEKGLIHRIVAVVIEDSQGRILLHKRATNMKIYPGRWDTVGGHVDVTPDYEESAKLELCEEAGINDAELDEVATFYLEEPYDNGVRAKRFFKVFWTRYDGEPGQADSTEVSAIKWFTKGEILELSKHPEQVSECLHRCLPYILDRHEDYEHQAAGQADRPVLYIR